VTREASSWAGAASICAIVAACACTPISAVAADPAIPSQGVAFDQHLGTMLPTHAPFVDEQRRTTTLASVLDGRAGIVVLGYYECPNLCSAVRQALQASLARVDLAPQAQYRVIAVSIDPEETQVEAAHAREALMAPAMPSGPGRPASALPGWHFLTAPRASTDALADAVGFHYVYDPTLRQYAHPAGIVIVTPQGRISRYFFGVDYPPRELQASVSAAAADSIGSPVRALLLRCFHFDPVTGRYSLAVIDASRLLALATVAALLGIVLWPRRRDRTAAGARMR
jgi:protein SCO1